MIFSAGCVETNKGLSLGAGTTQDGDADHWFGEKGRDAANPPYPLDAVLHSKTGVALAGLGTALQIKRRGNSAPLQCFT